MRSTLARIFTATAIALLLAGCGGGGGGVGVTTSPNPGSTSSTRSLALVLTQPWEDTQLKVVAGQSANVVASGTMQYISGAGEYCNLGAGQCVATPSGLPWSACSSDPAPAFTAPGLPCWSLIGKIGASGAPFEIGSSALITAAASGELYLGINDNVFTDNIGSWTVTATIQ